MYWQGKIIGNNQIDELWTANKKTNLSQRKSRQLYLKKFLAVLLWLP